MKKPVKKNESALPQPFAMREHAEEIAKTTASQSPENIDGRSPDEIRQTLHELRVHQIELDMQNEELRRVQAELEAARDKYFNFYDLAPVGYCNLSEKGLILEANLTIATMLGIVRSRLILQPLSPFILEEDKSIYYLHSKQLFETGEPQACELRIVKKDNTQFWARLDATAIQNADGALICRIMMSDITSRKRADEDKRNLEEHLQRAEKMEALGLLAGGVAHDLNNVLGIVVGYAELIIDYIDKESPIREDLFNIMGAGQRAAAIVHDMLTLARRGVASRKVLNLHSLILEFKKTPELEKLLSYHPAVQIQTDLAPSLLNISASSVHLEKTLFNLVCNACEAMPKGGNLTIKTTNLHLDKPVHGYDHICEGDYVVLSVSDTGEGISATDLKRIFEPFYTKKVMGRSGTGLGLAVVWGTLKDHDGYIDVQSEEGRGTIFSLYFPVTREDLTVETSSLSMSEYMGKGESILVVDDVKGQRDLAAALLKKLNYRVSVAANGEEAVEYLKQHEVDLLVLDMIMAPGMDGLDTYNLVLGIHPRQKAIIVSGFSESDRVKAAHDLGAGEYVKKPYVMETLGLAVKNELARLPVCVDPMRRKALL